MPQKEHFTNSRCLTFGTGLAIAGLSFGAQISGWTHWISIGVGYGVGLTLLISAAVTIIRSYLPDEVESSAIVPTQAPGIVPGVPSLSALLGQHPNIEFDTKQFFAKAYYSPVTAELENNIKVIAQQSSPADKEAFYARFVGVGAVAYQHDVTWYTIYGSQMKALADLNFRGLIPIDDLKKHYEKAAEDYPKTYENYTFDQWLKYMKERMLIVTYPSGMVEVSFNGQDFLKYLAHFGRSIDSKAN